MTKEEAEEYAKEMTYHDAVYNALQGKCIPYRKATLTKLYELLDGLAQKPCEDVISRQELLNNLEKPMNWTDSEAEVQEQRDYESFVSLVESMPSVTPRAKTGHWIFDEILDKHYYCSECKSMGVDYWDYCPYCGCRMVEPQESEDKE